MVMSPLNCQCVYISIYTAGTLFWTFSPSVQIDYLHYQICLIVHNSIAVDSLDSPFLTEFIAHFSKAFIKLW